VQVYRLTKLATKAVSPSQELATLSDWLRWCDTRLLRSAAAVELLQIALSRYSFTCWEGQGKVMLFDLQLRLQNSVRDVTSRYKLRPSVPAPFGLCVLVFTLTIIDRPIIAVAVINTYSTIFAGICCLLHQGATRGWTSKMWHEHYSGR